MKKVHILLIVVIAVLIGAILSTFSDASTYVDFKLAESNAGEKYTVVGKLNKEEELHFNPQTTMLRFQAIDKNGEERTVYFNQPKPTDFEKSEEITMKGFATDTAFIATEILMKCPSKYNEQNKMAGANDSYSSEP